MYANKIRMGNRYFHLISQSIEIYLRVLQSTAIVCMFLFFSLAIGTYVWLYGSGWFNFVPVTQNCCLNRNECIINNIEDHIIKEKIIVS